MDKPMVGQDQPDPPPSPRLAPPTLAPDSSGASADSPREERRTTGSFSRSGNPLSSSRSLPALCADEGAGPGQEGAVLEEEGEEPDAASRSPSPAYANGTEEHSPPDSPTRNWSCLQLHADDSKSLPSDRLAPRSSRASALPVDRWAENVNRYYGDAADELSELDRLYQASLRAPGRTGPGASTGTAGIRRTSSASARSKTPTPEIEKHVYTTHKGEDESYSADNMRRLSRSLSGTVLRSQTHTDPPVPRPPLRQVPSASTLPRRSSHAPFTADHTLHQHGPCTPAPPPPHPRTQPPRSPAPSGAGASLPDRYQTVPGEGLRSVALSYGTLPRAPRGAPPSPALSPCRPRTGPGTTQGPYSTLPRPDSTSYASLPRPDSTPYATLPRPDSTPYASLPRPDSTPYSTLPRPDPGPYSTLLRPDSTPYSTLPRPDSGPYSTLPRPDSTPYASSLRPDSAPYASLPRPDSTPYSTLPRPDSAPYTSLPRPDSTPYSTLPRPDSAPYASLPRPDSAPYASLPRPRRPHNSHYRQASFGGHVNGNAHVGDAPPQPRRLDVPPDNDWRQDVRRAPPPRPHQPLHRSVQLCPLCRHTPAEPRRTFCSSCGVYMSRFCPN